MKKTTFISIVILTFTFTGCGGGGGGSSSSTTQSDTQSRVLTKSIQNESATTPPVLPATEEIPTKSLD